MRENHDIIWNILLTLIKLMDYWINILVLYDSPLKLISASRLVLEIVSLLLTASIIKTSKWTSEHVISFIWKVSLFWKMFWSHFPAFLRKVVISQQTHHVDSTLKRRGNDRFHVVSTWNPRGVFVGIWALILD